MHQFSLLDQIADRHAITPLPAPADQEQAARRYNDWAELTLKSEHKSLDGISGHPGGQALLSSLFGNSPFLTNCLLRNPLYFGTLVSQSPEITLGDILKDLSFANHASDSVADVMALLREKKHQIALLTAVADISNLWSLQQVTHALSDFAQQATHLGVARLLADLAKAGQLDLPWKNQPEIDDPCVGSGFTILGMGKLGGRELNYSSDIDLIVLYDDETLRYTGDRSLGECMVRMTRELVKIMQTRTADGYVFRTDLRLRPDPRATPPALNMAAAEAYYESTGLNWERAAMIKARPIAGDLHAGSQFLERISPFVWRKHLDYAAVQDIHAIKHQIHSHHGIGAIQVAGHDVKLGRGGIREIEFIAQAHQLISGGRDPQLRERPTCRILQILADTEQMAPEATRGLIAAYEFLRTLEHRIQMVNDEQTHNLPDDPKGVDWIAIFMGYPDVADFSEALLGHLRRVHKYYENIFEDDIPQGDDTLARIVGAGESDPVIVDALAALDFKNPQGAFDIVHGWSLAPYRAMRYERARTLLADLVPALLVAVSSTADPDGALRRFDDFLKVLPEGVQLFSLLHANPWLLELLAEIMGSAPRLAMILGRNTGLLDGVLGAEFLTALPDVDDLSKDLDQTLSRARDYQDVLDLSRRWTNDHRFHVGIQVLRNTVSPAQAVMSLSDLADVAIRTLLPLVEREFAEQHGKFPGAEMCVLALGKLGGRELSFTSDLDLVFLYELADAEQSDGPKPLPPSVYFARLSQRFINALSAPTGEGRLYEVDMRLRPSGGAGPIAQTVAGFAKYQNHDAWTWEHMALTRARVVVASDALATKVRETINRVLSAPREAKKLVADVADMRNKLRSEFGTDNVWQVKQVQGGLLDVEFIAQYLALKHGAEHPAAVHANTGSVLTALMDAAVLDRDTGDLLLTAFELYTAVQNLIRLCTENDFAEATAPADLRLALCTTTGAEGFGALKQLLIDTEARVYSVFNTLIADPATKLSKDD
jgi:[glutamine synthetase] adenylyltransferase / [glutamine synthetase]-adenylyl-L-tyrosine phosphorylase